jgi:hypothetical protein
MSGLCSSSRLSPIEPGGNFARQLRPVYRNRRSIPAVACVVADHSTALLAQQKNIGFPRISNWRQDALCLSFFLLLILGAVPLMILPE